MRTEQFAALVRRAAPGVRLTTLVVRGLAVVFALCVCSCQSPGGSVPGQPLDRALRAQVARVFAASQAVRPEDKPELSVSKNGSLKISEDEIIYYPVADTYGRNGSHKNKSQGSEPVIAYKGTPGDVETQRKAFLRFDLADCTEQSAGGAFLELTCTMLQDRIANYATALEARDDAWTEAGLSWETMPAIGAVLGRTLIADEGAKIYIDLTAFVNERLRTGKKVFSISIQDMENKAARTEFSSREGMNPPALHLVLPGAPAASAPAPAAPRQADSGAYDYISVPLNRNSPPRTTYAPEKTRALSSLRDFIPVTERPALGKYGGDTSRADTATGFFYVKKDRGRWWLVDPQGFRVLNMALAAFSPGGTPHEKAGQQAVYGGNDEWAKKAVAHVKNDLGFNGLGAWSNDELVMRNEPFPYTKIIYFVTGYADSLGQAFQQSGHKGFENNILPVFDPAFEDFANKRAASAMAKLKNDPYLIGYFSDNELPATVAFLDNYLAIAEDDGPRRYSRAVAWEWLRRRYGPDAAPAAVTGRDRDDFRDFIYDYYAQVVTKAIRKSDPNHLYFGPRIHADAKTSPGIWRALGRYCDAIALNYYSVWEPSRAALAQWEAWSQKPVLISEWYVKAMDSGLANTSGAGWVVPTQNDRGLFYEQFALALLESGSCVGWQWFKYKDNDPDSPASDPSNVDGNKGIINTAFQEYTALTGRMRVINFNAYNLVDYFIRQNGR